jgi:tRNA G18 (ribose-2'-O)-methylase SpoU
VRARAWPADLAALRSDGVEIVGAVVAPGATPLARFSPPARFALLLGAEGPGLSAAARASCDHLVTIPMSPGADSLNVATAGAIFLWALMQSAPARR